ncbi:hypothetical protein WA026_010736 [Henosepilachna vigintioctopunctata]|uniref:t-SNARE coiled-coil homology domain-containing protein n=1 Tax=Henosepilachna vigintioctopunctata TaxID=420089 RepID=A0AAW1UQY6_9CUCU
MAFRSLTDVFLLMRSNAIRSRNIFPDHTDSERMHLVSLNDVEEGLYSSSDNRMPPLWIDNLEKTRSVLPHLKNKINDLKDLHAKHLHKPTFDDSCTDEEAIHECTQEISQLFNGCYKLVQIIKSQSHNGNTKERKLAFNVYRTIAASLQELSQLFKSNQNNYLKELQSREDRSKVFFENQVADVSLYEDENDDIDDYFIGTNQSTQQQLLYLEEENTRFALEREQEVTSIIKSIIEVNKIFKDLSIMVADQGTILDRIDYNIERTQIDVSEGFKQLQKANSYQRKNRKLCTIVAMTLTTILLFFILIVVKF